MRTPLNVGVVGLDTLGLRYANALAELPQVTLRWLCDEKRDLPQHTARRYATARVASNPVDLLDDEYLDAVMILEGGRSDLVWSALAADKHVFAAPPLAFTALEASELVQLAEGRGRALVVGDPLVADPASTRLKELVETGELGEVYALYANRQGIPPVTSGADGVWPFGVDELSLLLYLVEDDPIEIAARGESYLEPGVIDVAFCFLRFATGISAHLHLSWLDPLRIRRVTAIGSKRMAVFDDLNPERKLSIHERRANAGGPGYIVTPWIEPDDPIRIECERLVAAARTAPRDPNAQRAIAVVGLLETIRRSLEQDGVAPVPLEPVSRPELRLVQP